MHFKLHRCLKRSSKSHCVNVTHVRRNNEENDDAEVCDDADDADDNHEDGADLEHDGWEVRLNVKWVVGGRRRRCNVNGRHRTRARMHEGHVHGRRVFHLAPFIKMCLKGRPP